MIIATMSNNKTIDTNPDLNPFVALEEQNQKAQAFDNFRKELDELKALVNRDKE